MARIFLSYTIYDRELVERLEHALASRGHTVFVDRGTVDPGSSWAETIRDAIDRADAFLVVVSQDSLSRDFAVSAEVGAAWARGKRIVAIEPSEVSAADVLRLPRADYDVVRAVGLSDDQLVAGVLDKVKMEAISSAS